MIIYESEKSLAHLIADKTTSAINIPIRVTENKSEELIDSLNKIHQNGIDSRVGQAIAKVVANMTDECHPDLMYGSAILCSTVMNRNDDVFVPSETWAARKTPVNTPFNDQHIENDIIGHIIASRVLDNNGNVISDDSTEYPSYFDIEVDFVVYKDIFPGVASEIIQKAPQGQKFVSMECRFSNFDYALVDANYDAKIVQRSESTAFLTKYLRAYGGDGYYDGMRIGRVLRNFRFVGMGSVDVPANPASEYTKLCMSSQGILEKVESNLKVFLHVTKGKVMTIENLDQAKELITNLTNEVDQLKAELANATKSIEGVSTVQAEIDQLKNDLTAANSKVEIAEQKLAQTEAKVAELTTNLESAKTELETKASALAKIESDAKAAERLAKLKDLGIELDDAKREKFIAMNDETFASVVEFGQSLKAKATVTEPATNVTDTSTVADAENAANEALDSANATEEVEPEATPGDATPDDEKLKTVAEKLVASLLASRTRKDKANKK
jgi:predicted  nucleic acid-binding Zn-ribbon protein